MNKDLSIQKLIENMTLEQKIGQCVVVGMSGTVITNDLREAITRYHCSGIRLSPFTRIFRYFTDDKAKQQSLGEDFTPSMQKNRKKGSSPLPHSTRICGNAQRVTHSSCPTQSSNPPAHGH